MKTAFQKKAYSILDGTGAAADSMHRCRFSSSRAAALELEGTGKADNPYLLSTRRRTAWSLRKRQRLIPAFVQC